jgi:hypothetical protein
MPSIAVLNTLVSLAAAASPTCRATWQGYIHRRYFPRAFGASPDSHVEKAMRAQVRIPTLFWSTRSYIEHGLLVVGLSILPMFLNLFGLPYVFMWRLSSLLAAILLVISVGSFVVRYRQATMGRPPVTAWLHFFYDGWRCARSFCECWRYS